MDDASFHSQEAATTALQPVPDHELRVPYYCEENVWRLTYRKVREHQEDNFFVVFISNSIKNVPMFQQRASDDPAQAVCWDYHVILCCARAAQRDVVVFDIDSVLPYPCSLHDYLQHSFPYQWPAPFAPMFRVVPAHVFLPSFASDRMHMFNAKTQKWNAPPPHYACINIRSAAANGGNGTTTTNTTSNLKGYLEFMQRPEGKTKQQNQQAMLQEEDLGTEPGSSTSNIYGTILSLQQLQHYPGFFAQESMVG